ncbi:hypothetical protein TWF718_003378 [Orbilia javanica]|uniref:Uncharacterized protein n=1 Tax=Orbilia javanica TaxID=47235 RepID=A0AAN8RA17_9PEZI
MAPMCGPPLEPEEITTATPDPPPRRFIQIRVAGVRSFNGRFMSYKKGGRREFHLCIGGSPMMSLINWCNFIWGNKGAIGLYNPNTGVYSDFSCGPTKTDFSHYKDISEEDVTWRFVYPNKYDYPCILYPILMLVDFEIFDIPIPILYIKHIEKGIYLPTWRSRIEYKWTRFLEIITLGFVRRKFTAGKKETKDSKPLDGKQKEE